MADNLPDPEMRKFLTAGNSVLIANALKAHIARGLILDINKDICRMTLEETQIEVSTAQMLKNTVATANALFGVFP